MTDERITALTALTALDPAADWFEVVDVSDTSLAATGTNKKITRNHLLDPSTLSRLALSTTAPPTGNASSTTPFIPFPASPFDSTYENIGTDLAVDAVDTRIDILTAGVYSLYVLAIIQSTTLIFGDLNVGGFDPFTGIGLGFSMTDDTAGQWASIFTETYYLPAATQVQLSINAKTSDLSTWDVNSVDVRIQRLA